MSKIVNGTQLLGETLVIGIIFTIMFMIVHVLAMYVDAEFSMSHTGMAIAAFVAAALFHLSAEYSGWNRRFCDEYR